jgi:hypothetical protein
LHGSDHVYARECAGGGHFPNHYAGVSVEVYAIPPFEQNALEGWGTCPFVVSHSSTIKLWMNGALGFQGFHDRAT